MRRILAVLVIAVAGSACADCPDAFDASAAGTLRPGQRLVLDVPAGNLRVTGRERAPNVELRARGCSGGAIGVDTLAGGIAIRVSGSSADVEVILPAGAPVAIRHADGPVRLRATGGARLHTGEGRVTVEGVLGDLELEASSGRLTVRGVTGEAFVTHGDGMLEIVDVSAGVRIRDGAGGIRVREVAESVVVERDGSGEIDVEGVGGDFVVEEKREDARLIRYSGVTGRVRLPSDLLPP